MTVYGLGDVRPTLGRDTWIAPSAAVIGDVALGDETSVWFGTVVRGDCFPIRIGARTNLQDNVVVHVTGGKARTLVGDEVTVGHAAILHGCTIGSRVLVGMGSTILDGVTVGDGSVVAAGTLLTPGTAVPPRSMVMGRPGRVVRAVSADELAWVRDAAALYLGYARRFRTSLRAVDDP